MCHKSQLFSIILNYSWENNENNEESVTRIVIPMSRRVGTVPAISRSHVATRLKGHYAAPYCQDLRIPSLVQIRCRMVYAVLPI